VYALDAESGEQQWTVETGDRVYASPTAVDGTVFVGSFDAGMYALDTESGEQRWRFAADAATRSSPTVVEETVFFGDQGGTVYAVAAGVFGASAGSRVRQGTLGHYHDRAERVSVRSAPSFDVTLSETNAPVTAGEDLRVVVDVHNTGERSGTQRVELAVGSLETVARPLTLAGGNATTESFTISTAAGDSGEYTLRVTSGDDTDTGSVTVASPATPADDAGARDLFVLGGGAGVAALLGGYALLRRSDDKDDS